VAITNGVTTQAGTPLVGLPPTRPSPIRNVCFPTRRCNLSGRQPCPHTELAARYLDLKRDALGEDASVPDFGDVTFSTTFTTTGVDDVLLANAAPQTHFEKRVRTAERKAALNKLLDGTYNLSGIPLDDGASQTDKDINQKIFELLSQEDDGADSLLFHEGRRTALRSGPGRTAD